MPWMQAVADATGLPVDTVAVSEGAALGRRLPGPDGRRARVLVRGRRRMVPVGRRIDPDPDWAAAAARRFEQFEALGPPG